MILIIEDPYPGPSWPGRATHDAIRHERANRGGRRLRRPGREQRPRGAEGGRSHGPTARRARGAARRPAAHAGLRGGTRLDRGGRGRVEVDRRAGGRL